MDKTTGMPNAICFQCKHLRRKHKEQMGTGRLFTGQEYHYWNGPAEVEWSCEKALPGRLEAHPLIQICMEHELAPMAYAPPIEKIKIERYREKKQGNLTRKGSW